PRLCRSGSLWRRLPVGLDAPRFILEPALERPGPVLREGDLRRVYVTILPGQPVEAHDEARVGGRRHDLEAEREACTLPHWNRGGRSVVARGIEAAQHLTVASAAEEFAYGRRASRERRREACAPIDVETNFPGSKRETFA